MSRRVQERRGRGVFALTASARPAQRPLPPAVGVFACLNDVGATNRTACAEAVSRSVRRNVWKGTSRTTPSNAKTTNGNEVRSSTRAGRPWLRRAHALTQPGNRHRTEGLRTLNARSGDARPFLSAVLLRKDHSVRSLCTGDGRGLLRAVDAGQAPPRSDTAPPCVLCAWFCLRVLLLRGDGRDCRTGALLAPRGACDADSDGASVSAKPRRWCSEHPQRGVLDTCTPLCARRSHNDRGVVRRPSHNSTSRSAAALVASHNGCRALCRDWRDRRPVAWLR